MKRRFIFLAGGMATIIFTSGTTSMSKAVMLSQRNVASNVYDLQSVEDIRETDVNIALLPFHHIFGSTCMVVMLAAGIKTAFPDGLRYVAQNLKEYKVSIFVCVPLLLEAMYKKIQNLPSVAFEEIGVGEFVNRLYNDPDRVMELLQKLIKLFYY